MEILGAAVAILVVIVVLVLLVRAMDWVRDRR